METLRILLLIGIFLFLILNKHTTNSQGVEISDKTRIRDLQERVSRILNIMKTSNDTLERVANLESSTATPVIPITVQPTTLGKCYNSQCWKYYEPRKWCYTRRPERPGVVTCTGRDVSENCDATWGCDL